MKIIRNEESATWTFQPVDMEEEQSISSIVKVLKHHDRIFYTV